MDIDWAKKQREAQKRKNYEENQKKIGLNILNIEKNEEEFDWEQVKIPGLTVKGSTPQEMMTMYNPIILISSILKTNLGVSIVQLFKLHQGLVTKNVMKEELVRSLVVSINSLSKIHKSSFHFVLFICTPYCKQMIIYSL